MLPVSERGESPTPTENDYEEKTSDVENEENVTEVARENEQDNTVNDGYLADNDSDEDDPLIQSVSTCCFVYVFQGNSQSVTS